MARRYGVSEMLKMVNNLKEYQDRLQSLSTCSNIIPLVGILKYMFDPNIKFNLPTGAPPYKLNEQLDQQGSLFNEFRRLYLFIDGAGPELKSLKREMLFVQLLESLDQEDAKLVIAMKDKQSPYSNITYELVYNAFPGLLPEQSETIVKNEKYLNNTNPNSGLLSCPFGCTTKNSPDGFFGSGPLTVHLKKVHNYTTEQVQEYKKGFSI